MDTDKMFSDAKRAATDQRAAAQAVLDSAADAADLAVLRNAATTITQLAEVMALTKPADPT